MYDPNTSWYEYFVRPGTAPHMLNLFLFLVVYGMSYVVGWCLYKLHSFYPTSLKGVWFQIVNTCNIERGFKRAFQMQLVPATSWRG